MTDSIHRALSRAQRHLADGNLFAARVSLESLLLKQPDHVPGLLAMSRVSYGEGRLREAAFHVSKASRHRIDDEELVCDIAEMLLKVGDAVAAKECLDRPLFKATQDGLLLIRLAALRKMLGQHPDSIALLDRAAAAGMTTAEFRFQYALELIFNGRMQEAEAQLNAALELSPTFGRAALARTRLHKQTPEHNHLADLRNRLSIVAPGSDDHAALEFALYKELEDTGVYSEAWDALARGNRTLFARQSHDSAVASSLFNELIARCPPEFFQGSRPTHAGPQPIFIIGMPRSGTTLLDRVLGNHSQVTSVGELDDFGLQLRWIADHGITLDHHIVSRLDDLDYSELGRRYLAQTQWRAQGAPFYVDKLPRNWMVAGLIHRALPGVRILNLSRDPMDVCFSNYRALLGEGFPWSYDLDALADHYLQYRRVMAHWHAVIPGAILDVPYSELTREPEATSRKVLEFCGLDWEPGCADVTRNKSAVATLSMSQVREPIHTRFFNEWRNYERQMEPLRLALGEYATLAASLI